MLCAALAVRLLAINQPIIDAHLLRQAQTAEATRYLSTHSGWHLSSQVTWLGDRRPYLLQEFPVYNYLVVVVDRALGSLDRSGKVTSVALWLMSFVILQGIWRRLLAPAEAFWANVLFVSAPLSVFFGQAFMPEMLVQVIAFGFVLSLLAYLDKHQSRFLVLAALLGILGAVVKFPEVSHLYVLAAGVVLVSARLRALRQPRYWLVAVVILAAAWMWARLVNDVNGQGMPGWTATESLRAFVGSWRDRTALAPYARILAYLVAFVVGPVGAWFAWQGLRSARRQERWLLLAWAASLLVFVAMWGTRTAGSHSYYNLPALGPLSALFGIGFARRAWPLKSSGSRAPLYVAVALLLIWQIAGSWYLFRQDRVIYDSARWVYANTGEDDPVILVANHHPSTINFPHMTVFSYYAERPLWVWTSYLSPDDRQRALARARWVVVTEAPANSGLVERLRRLVRGDARPATSTEWLTTDPRFTVRYRGAGFVVYSRTG